MRFDTEKMTVEQITKTIAELRNIRERMSSARSRKHTLEAIQENMREDGLVVCNKYTGEVFDADEWLIYDEQTNTTYEGDWAP